MLLARRQYLLLGQGAFLVSLIFTLYFGRHHLQQLTPSSFLPTGHGDHPNNASDIALAAPERGILSQGNITKYVHAIMNPEAMDLPRLQCPQLDTRGYEGLRAAPPVAGGPPPPIQYFFALDLRACLPLLPRLLGSVVEAIRFLGPASCALSIVEGHSPDGTAEVLAALRPELAALGTTYHLLHSDVDPSAGQRVARLAELRNLALRPLLLGGDDDASDEGRRRRLAPGATVVFLNDVAACAEDVLELAHQRAALGADMTCAMDWTYAGRDPTFYDVWVARGLTGDSFFAVPADGSWDAAWNLFWNDAGARARLRARRPFQVFSCWNGAVAFAAAPVAAGEVAFRAPRAGECYQGEPQLFCKDLWFRGRGRIAVVPSVNLEYSDERGRQIKEAKGYTSQWAGRGATGEGEAEEGEDAIEWQAAPPETVKCMPSYDNQYFEAWDALQPGRGPPDR